jgi:hypothetical protein
MIAGLVHMQRVKNKTKSRSVEAEGGIAIGALLLLLQMQHMLLHLASIRLPWWLAIEQCR